MILYTILYYTILYYTILYYTPGIYLQILKMHIDCLNWLALLVQRYLSNTASFE